MSRLATIFAPSLVAVLTPAGYGYYDNSRWVDQARGAAYAQAKATGATSANDIMREVDKATVQVRQSMTERYRIEF